MRNIEHNKKLLSIFVLISYVLMIAVNVVANFLPLNNMTTGAISDKYNNLFAPVGFAFLIWIVIYLLLGKYCLYQFQFNSRRPDNNDRVVRKVNTYFVIANIINGIWIFAWHYEQMLLSAILMFVLLILLISIRINITHRSNLSKSERISIEVPFSVYFAWITVATIANVSTYLVFNGWYFFGFSESLITVIVLALGLIISLLTIFNFKDIVYGVVVIWAYSGILYKHINPEMLNREYEDIIITLIASIVLLILGIIGILLTKKPKRRTRR